MKRFHVNLSVANLEQSIQFYSQLFKAEPTVLKHDYAKWMLDDPHVNFSINNRGLTTGINHLGLQAENETEFSEIGERLKSADAKIFDEGATTCCYAKSDKAWVHDPDGIAWETFITHGESTTYGSNPDEQSVEKNSSPCCEPSVVEKPEVIRPHGKCC